MDTHFLNGSFSLFGGCLLADRSRFHALLVTVSAGQALADTCYFILLYFEGVFNGAMSTYIIVYMCTTNT